MVCGGSGGEDRKEAGLRSRAGHSEGARRRQRHEHRDATELSNVSDPHHVRSNIGIAAESRAAAFQAVSAWHCPHHSVFRISTFTTSTASNIVQPGPFHNMHTALQSRRSRLMPARAGPSAAHEDWAARESRRLRLGVVVVPVVVTIPAYTGWTEAGAGVMQGRIGRTQPEAALQQL